MKGVILTRFPAARIVDLTHEIVVHWPRPDGVYAGDERVLEHVATEVLPQLTD